MPAIKAFDLDNGVSHQQQDLIEGTGGTGSGGNGDQALPFAFDLLLACDVACHGQCGNRRAVFASIS